MQTRLALKHSFSKKFAPSRQIIALGFLAFLNGTRTQAAEPAERPTLIGPAWKAPVPPCAWKMTVQTTGKSAQSAAITSNQRVASASIVNASNFHKESIQLESGQSNEVWFLGSTSYSSDPGSNTAKLSLTEQGIGGTYPDLSEFAWVKAEAFRGPFVINGESYLIFAAGDEPEPTPPPAPTAPGTKPIPNTPKVAAQKWPAGPIAGFPLKPGIQVAAINEKTRLPKYLQYGNEIRQYEFSTPGKEELELPKKIQAAQFLNAPKKISPLPLP